MDANHKQRVQDELKAVGVTWFGFRKFSVKYVPQIIHPEEHIKGVVYGRYKEENGSSLNEGMLIATDLRIIFLDHKPGYTKTDEITYDVVSAVTKVTAVFSSVTLKTRLGDYTLRFANSKVADGFVKYVEERRLEKLHQS